MATTITETEDRDEIVRLNALFPEDFLPLTEKELRESWWWLARSDDKVVGFCGMLDFYPFDGYCYLKRAAVLPKYLGGWQREMLRVREDKARAIGHKHLVTECETKNVRSANNLIRQGFLLFHPMRPWTPDPTYLYWIKDIQ